MNELVVLYIDDDEKDARRVLFELEKHFSAEAIKPEEDPLELIDRVFSFRPDAVIIDFRLSELDSSIHYDGYRILQEILGRKENFPVFLLTSHQDDAFVEVDDVNVVYEKGELFKGTSTFLNRVATQIIKYKNRIMEGEQRLLKLLEQRKNSPLSLDEEKELIRLDGFIERSLEKEGAVPDELKITSNEKRVSDILKEVDELIKKVNKNLPNS
jgi:CheY-like chemotaxis protein